MTQFSDAFRKNVTVPAALSAMLFSEECSGASKLAEKVQIAIENMHHDMIMISRVCDTFAPDCTEGDALKQLVKLAESKLEANKNELAWAIRDKTSVSLLLPDEAILEVIENHQQRFYQTEEDVRSRIALVQEAFSIAGNLLQTWAA